MMERERRFRSISGIRNCPSYSLMLCVEILTVRALTSLLKRSPTLTSDTTSIMAAATHVPFSLPGENSGRAGREQEREKAQAEHSSREQQGHSSNSQRIRIE